MKDAALFVSIPLFSGRITAVANLKNIGLDEASQSLCFQGVLLRRNPDNLVQSPKSQSLCFQGVLLRFFSLKERRREWSQSLCFQGVLLRRAAEGLGEAAGVSIPLFSGRITAKPVADKAVGKPVSQSLCFQGVLLRERIEHPAPEQIVSIPLFSGRITAVSARWWASSRLCLNPFVFRAYYCGPFMEIFDG